MLDEKLKTGFKRIKQQLKKYASVKNVEVDQADTYYLSNSAPGKAEADLFAAIQIKDGCLWLTVNANEAKALLTNPELSHLAYYYRGNGTFRFFTLQPELEPGLALLLQQLDPTIQREEKKH